LEQLEQHSFILIPPYIFLIVYTEIDYSIKKIILKMVCSRCSRCSRVFENIYLVGGRGGSLKKIFWGVKSGTAGTDGTDGNIDISDKNKKETKSRQLQL
jgi:hypothetical protein